MHFNKANIPYVYFEATLWCNDDGSGGTPETSLTCHYQTSDPAFESTGGQIMHTKYDNLKTLNALLPGRLFSNMSHTSQIVYSMLTKISPDTPGDYEKDTPQMPTANEVETEPQETKTIETTKEPETSENVKVSETSEVLQPNNGFTDIPEGAYYAGPVAWAVAHGIASGTGKSSFRPQSECTRGQIVTFLWRAAGSPEPISTSNPFIDVPAGQYYTKAVLWAVENGITSGTDITQFSPHQACTRGQALTLIWRANGKPVSDKGISFVDINESDYYAIPVMWALEHNITSGMDGIHFSPNANCNRAQIITFLWRNTLISMKSSVEAEEMASERPALVEISSETSAEAEEITQPFEETAQPSEESTQPVIEPAETSTEPETSDSYVQ